MTKTILRPSDSKKNPYINIVRKCIENAGYEVLFIDDIKKIEGFFIPISIVNLNWYENIPSSNRIVCMLYCLKKKLVIYFFKLVKRSKIIITLHNKYDHGTNRDISTNMLKWLLLKSDKIIVLCNESSHYLEHTMGKQLFNEKIKSKIFSMFLPNYCDSYMNNENNLFDDIRGAKKGSTFELLYFGRIEAYKNVPILVELAKRIHNLDIHITIIGDGDKNIVEWLEVSSQEHDNVTFSRQFLSDDVIWGVISCADCIIMPYKTGSVLNSGAVMLAYSIGKNVICPQIGTVLDFPKELTYCYSDDKPLDNLYDKVVEVFNEFQNNRNVFNEKAKKIHDITIRNYSQEELTKRIKILYDELSGKI